MNDAKLKRERSNGERLVSFVIPVCDEAESLEELHAKINKAMESVKGEHETLFIDDGSRDRSFEVIKSLSERDPRVRAIRFRRNFGKSAAYMAGFRRVRGDVVVTMDADLQDDPADLPALLSKLDEGWDVVNGWKHHGKGPLNKSIPSRIFNFVVSTITRIPLHDFNCPFKAYRREVIDEIEIHGELHRYIPVIARTRGFTIAEVPISNSPRKHGRSKYGVERFLRGLFDLITILFITRFAKRPLHLLGLTGIISFMLGGGILAVLIIAHFMFHWGFTADGSWNLHDRPAISLGVLLLIVGVQFFSIGLIGELIVTGQNAVPSDAGYSIKETIGT